ncbi:MAG: TonB-dependent receptor [Longimicrobiales bacterium]|nr:TonB-dependent receptor [Longimicrobiales bacterium]
MIIDSPAPHGPAPYSQITTFCRTAVLAALGWASLAAPSPVEGQVQDTLRQDTVYEIEPIAVRAVRPSATPGGVSAIQVRLDSVRFRPAPLLEHVLRELPLVQVRSNSRGEAQLALRGAEERQIAILLDGVPLTLGWDHRTDLSVIPLTAAQSIRIVRGLSSVLHGPNVLGGVVEVGLGSVATPSVEPIRVAAGLDDTGGYNLGVASGTVLDLEDGRLLVRAGVGRRERDGFASPPDVEAAYPALAGEELRVNSYLEHTDGFASVRYSDRGGWISASTTAFRAERGVPPELDDDAPRLWRYPELWRSVTVLTGGLEGLSNDLGMLDVEASLGVDLGSTTIHDFAMPASPSDPGTATEAFFATLNETEESDDRTVTARLRADQHLESGVTVSAAATFADVRHEEVITTDLTGTPTARPGDYQQRLWSIGTEADVPFALDVGPFTGGRVSGGLALDGMDTPRTGGTVAEGPSTSEWGGRLGLSASTTSGSLLLHTAVSRKGRFPALREMYSTALGRFEPNPGLRPEILTVLEAGFTSRFGRYDLQMVGFHQRLDNAIVRGAPPASSSAEFQRVNRDLIRSTGLEILAGYSVGRFALETEVTLQNVEVVEPGATGVRAEYEPEIAGGVGGTVPLLAGIEAGAEVEYWGRQFCSTPDPGLESYVTLDPSTRADLQLARTFRLPDGPATFQRLGLELAVDNLADSAVYDQCGLPQPGRTLRLQIRLN